MGCCSLNARNQSNNPIEIAIRSIIKDMKLSSMTFENFELSITKLVSKEFTDDEFFSWVEANAVDLKDENIYKDAQLILVFDFNEIESPNIDFYAWAFSLLMKPQSSEVFLFRILKKFHYQGLDSLTCFKDFLDKYLKFNIVWFNKRMNNFFKSKHGRSLILDYNITQLELIDINLNRLDEVFSLRICQLLYINVVSDIEEILRKNNNLKNSSNQASLHELQIDEPDLAELSIKRPYLWDSIQLRDYITEFTGDINLI